MPPHELTGVRARRIAERIRQSFARHRIPLDGSPLAQSLEDLDWLGTEDGEVFRSGGPYQRDKDRTTAAVVAAVRLTRIAHCLLACVQLPGFKGVARHLRRLHTELHDPQGVRTSHADRQAWDLLFEVEVAGLLSASGHRIRMEEPDLVIELDREPGFALACKRPQSLDTMRRVIADAGSQLLKQHPAGLVLINLDAVIGSRDALAGYALLETTNAVDALCQRKVDWAVERSAQAVALGLDDAGGGAWPHVGAIGVLFVANFVVSAAYPERKCKYMNSKTVVAMVADLRIDEGARLVAVLRERMQLGQAMFRSEDL